MQNTKKHMAPLVVFDGICNLCNSSVNYIIKHDHKNRLKYTPIQSEHGKSEFKKHKIDTTVIDSIVLIENDKYYVKSKAIMLIARHMGGVYYMLYLFMKIIPTFIEDAIYDIIAKNRYKWFGKKESCIIPSDEVKSKFIL